MFFAALLLAADLIVDVTVPSESTGTMHYADSMTLRIGHARPLTLFEPPVPLAGPHFQLPDGRFLLLGWSSPGAGMQSMHALLIGVRGGAVVVDRQMIVSTDRADRGLLLRFRKDGTIRIGIAEPQYWSGDEEMWYLDLGNYKPLGFRAMHRLRFERIAHEEKDVFYNGGQPARMPSNRVAWVEITSKGFKLKGTG